MPGLRLFDVRADMPSQAGAAAQTRTGAILGLAVHHSAIINPATGLASGGAREIFELHVHERGWEHGGYHYLIAPNGRIEYALDETVAGYHAGFHDPDNLRGLEHGQFWNQHYLAVCLLGWFDSGRQAQGAAGQPVPVPDFFTHPAPAQWQALLDLIRLLRGRYAFPLENVRGHRELAGSRTRCPGGNIDLDALRAALRAE